jgi:hypothetical protein
MARRNTPKQTPMQQAIRELHENASGTGLATAEQLKATADKYDVPVWELEGLYLDECDRLADE